MLEEHVETLWNRITDYTMGSKEYQTAVVLRDIIYEIRDIRNELSKLRRDCGRTE